MPSVQRTFTLPDELSQNFDESVPTQKRSKFLAKALAEALRKRNVKRLFEAIDNMEAVQLPNGKSAEDVIQEIRQQESDKLLNR